MTFAVYVNVRIAIMRANESIKEEATAGATSASMMASISSVVGGKRKITKTGRYGAPKAPQKLNADGTAVNALDMKNNVMGGKTIKR